MAMRGLAAAAAVALVGGALFGPCGSASAQLPPGLSGGTLTLSAATVPSVVTNTGVLVNSGIVTQNTGTPIRLTGGTISQTTPIYDWKSYNVASSKSVTFVAPGTAVAVVSVVARGPSIIAGVPGPTSTGAPVSQGAITVREGGLVGLVGPTSARNGTIIAKVSKETVGGVETTTVDLAGDGLIKLQVGPSAIDAGGRPLSADSRAVALTAGAARDMVNGVVNAPGRNHARTVMNEGGVIVFGGPSPR